jgi:TPR repeat protein
MRYTSKHNKIIFIIIVSLLYFSIYEILSTPYEPSSYVREQSLKKDSIINPEISELIELPLPVLEDFAYQGYDKSQYIVGMRYQFGVGTFSDYHRATIWYERSAKGGDPAGMYWFSKINNKLTVNIEKQLIEKSAELGYWRAIRELQLNDLSRDFSNVPASKFNLDKKIYHDNKQDFYLIYQKAMHMYREKLKNIEGNRLLSNFKIETADDEKMIEFFKIASTGGNRDAQLWMGQFYEKTDAEQSERWIVHSAFNGNKDAFTKLAYLQSKKFFTKVRMDLGEKLKPNDSFNYYHPEGLIENKKHYARLAYFWQQMAEDNGFNFDLWFYERWPIDRIVKECKGGGEFTKECKEKYAFGIIFGETYAKYLLEKF